MQDKTVEHIQVNMTLLADYLEIDEIVEQYKNILDADEWLQLTNYMANLVTAFNGKRNIHFQYNLFMYIKDKLSFVIGLPIV